MCVCHYRPEILFYSAWEGVNPTIMLVMFHIFPKPMEGIILWTGSKLEPVYSEIYVLKYPPPHWKWISTIKGSNITDNVV